MRVGRDLSPLERAEEGRIGVWARGAEPTKRRASSPSRVGRWSTAAMLAVLVPPLGFGSLAASNGGVAVQVYRFACSGSLRILPRLLHPLFRRDVLPGFVALLSAVRSPSPVPNLEGFEQRGYG